MMNFAKQSTVDRHVLAQITQLLTHARVQHVFLESLENKDGWKVIAGLHSSAMHKLPLSKRPDNF